MIKISNTGILDTECTTKIDFEQQRLISDADEISFEQQNLMQMVIVMIKISDTECFHNKNRMITN